MISIITPVYNGEKFIESCLQVVIGQDCQDVEHVIVDGASKDGTMEIVKQYAAKYPHIRWLSEPDKGQSDAMNKGISLARGEILSILNVDDYYEGKVLNRVAKLFRDLPEPTLLVGNCQVWDTQGQLKYINKPQKLTLPALLMGWKINPHPVNPVAYFYHKSLHEKIGLYDIDEHYALDLDFLFKAVQVANVEYRDEVWGNYRSIEGTKTVTDKQNRTAVKRKAALMKQYLQALPVWQQNWIRLRRIPTQLEETWEAGRIRVDYFSRHPEEILLSLQKKLNQPK